MSIQRELDTLLDQVDDVLATAAADPVPVDEMPGTALQLVPAPVELDEQDEPVDEPEPADVLDETDVEPVRAPRPRWWARLRRRAAVVDADIEDAAQLLFARLHADRAVVQVGRHDEVSRQLGAATHEVDLAQVQQWRTASRQARKQQRRDAAEEARLAALYRRATREGARAKIRATILGSAEMRALRLARVRTVTLVVLMPVLLAFAAWSTTGVQAGVVRLLGLEDRSPMWWAAWGVEPALITIVALIIVVRAVLRSSGGDTDNKATAVEWGALGMSLVLNVAGGWIGGLSLAGLATGLVTALPHTVGPLGCAGTAFLIGLIDAYVTAAKPWAGAPSLDTLDLGRPPVPQVPPVPQMLTVPGAVAVPVKTPVPATAGTGTAGTAGTGTRRRRAVPAAGTRRPALTARTGRAGTAAPQPGTAKAAARTFWDAEIAAGRTPTGTDLARAAGRDGDPTGVFRRYARDWAAENGGARHAS
ncbi:hypothetical protein [Actinoplanes subglobosus]|uniref:Uncharacterized protein n=1 Tax=Actinoplanes subglobosus TaxID=1547892 RepID=A0ABV8IRA5_9ACTN